MTACLLRKEHLTKGKKSALKRNVGVPVGTQEDAN